MSIWKKIAVALVIGSSLGVFSAYSTVAVAAEDRAGSRLATENTIKAINGGIEATNNGARANEIRKFYLEARQFAKEITGETIARDLQFGNDGLLAVSRSLKTGPDGAFDREATLKAWEEVLQIFTDIKNKQL